MSERRITIGMILTAALLATVGISGVALAGSLEPPGPPASTMKTLDDVEPRTPIHATDIPYVIFEPGFYYLVEDVATFNTAIYITSDHVTLDLMGHRLSGGLSFGIEASSVNDVVIRNGTVSGWGISGIYVEGSRIRIEKIHAAENTGTGINVGDHAIVDGCTATGNNVGIAVGNHGVITESRVSDNDSYGIDAGEHARIAACNASTNGRSGIRVGRGSIVRDSISSANQGAGIEVDSGSYVLANHCHENGLTDPPGEGIHVRGSGSRIDGNHLVGNGRGVYFLGSGNSFVRNSLFENLEPDVPWSGNQIGPYVSADDATNPWSNLSDQPTPR